ncbi:hypothetical protein CK203_040542 [Vitis vinifera]|uniref:Uncharacterized protein n=1 Tax=Vitis vinifera TaxID=29760 RepID=A0A438HHX5_VITVI|nr:hypothetical protein CK203_040542 [Vitis vinifera]
MAALFYFEDKVHLKQLQRAKKYPLFFTRMLGTILEYYGFPTEPDKEKKHHCREVYTVSRWQDFGDGEDTPQDHQLPHTPGLTQRQLVQRVDELTMAVQQWNSSSEKPASVHDAHPLSIPPTQETNSTTRESTVPTTILTPSEITPPIHLMLEDRECPHFSP